MEKQKTTIYDIAYRAGVSQSTVSRVLSGNTNVSDDKKVAVLNAVEALGYRPNLFAQRLASGEASAIGILATNTETPFFTQVIRGIQETLAPSPYLPLIVSVQGLGDLERAVELLRASYVGGVCVVGQALPSKLLQDLQADMPVFAVCPDTPGIEAQCLLVDNEGGGYRATKHLLDLGHRRIAHIAGPPHHPHAIGRMAGYRRALQEAGVAFDPQLVAHGNFTEPSGIDAANQILHGAAAFSALFAANDCMAFGAQVALYHKGLHVPTQVSLVGFDNSPQAAFRTPPLTTVCQPAVLMGAAVAKQILAALTRQPAAENQRFETPLVVRESTAAFAQA